MLKVVGASWLKTRISSYIIAGASLLAVGFLFLADIERPIYDGTYCATAYWTHQTGFRVEFWGQQNDLQKIPKGVARICYKDSTFDNGWSKIEIETQPTYADWIQAFAAGMLEGALTWKSVHNHWSNTIESYCNNDDSTQLFCVWLRDTISANYDIIKELADEKSHYDQYWYQVRLFYYQLEGLEYGWRKGVHRSRTDLEIDAIDFLLLNAASDIRDLGIYFETFVNYTNMAAKYHMHPPKASMLLSFLSGDGADIVKKVLVGHSSDGSYSAMLRMLKKYKFHYHHTRDAKSTEVTGVDITFTGYPGCIASHDDFYMIRGRKTKLTVGGIHIQNANLDLWKNVDLDTSVLLAARVMTANRLAHNGRTWAKIISRNPGFGIKQWFVLDVKRLQRSISNQTNPVMDVIINDAINGTSPHVVNGTHYVNIIDEKRYAVEAGEIGMESINTNGKHLLWIIDQLPGRLHAEDMTQDIVYGAGVWTSNGFPYFKEMINTSKIQIDPSYPKIVHKFTSNLTDLDAVDRLLRSRAYRGDVMNDKDRKAFGNIDIKLYSETNTGETEFYALSGPISYLPTLNKNEVVRSVKNVDSTVATSISNEQLSEIEIISEQRPIRHDMLTIAMSKTTMIPFRWSNLDLDVQHSGHPDVWNFGKISPTWAWKHDNM